MIKIDSLKEKELLVAYYYARKEKADITPQNVYSLWCSWWRYDFRINGNPVFKMKDSEIVFKRDNPDNDIELLKEYNETFYVIYNWIFKFVSEHKNNYIKETIRKQRVKQLYILRDMAKPLGYTVKCLSSGDELSKVMNYRIFYIVGNKKVTKDGNFNTIKKYFEDLQKSMK